MFVGRKIAVKKRSNDASCAKLLMKKSSGHLRISLAMFLLSITVTSVIGLLFAKQYFQYEKDFLENVAVHTINVDASFGNHTLRSVIPADTENVQQFLKKEFPSKKISVIPVYTNTAGLTINGAAINLFAIDQRHGFLVNLDEILDKTAYFTVQQPKTIALEISAITEMSDGGFVSSELERFLLRTSTGVSPKTPILTSKNILPSMLESPTCFINTNTFCDISSVLLKKEVKNIDDVTGNNGLIQLSGLYIFVDDLRLVSSVSSFLTEQNYRAYAPADAFDDFGETVSVMYTVFLLSSIVLLCITTLNIFLSFRSFYRVQQKDMGVLRYMGFDNKRIYRMYRRNLGKKFLQIMGLSALLILIVGTILFSFAHWFVLFGFIVSLSVFLGLLFVAVSRFIIHNYVRQDLLVLIRESKEFE
jgi:hypothetical protein